MESTNDPAASANKAALVLIPSIIFPVLAFIIVAFRLVTRFGIIHNVGLEDWFITVALLFSIAFTVLVWEQVKHGLGSHFAFLPPGEYTESLKPFWASIIFYYLSITFTKISILIQYLRIFVGRTIRRACWITLVGNVILGLWWFFGCIFTCYPVSYFWDKTIEGHCLNETGFWFSGAGLTILTDLIILTLPMPELHTLQLPKKQKLGLMLVFAIGAVVCIISIVRLRSLYTISVSADVTWDNVDAAAWSTAEINIGIICASLPCLKAFISRFFPNIFNHSSQMSNAPGIPSVGGTRRSTNGHQRSSMRNSHNPLGGYGDTVLPVRSLVNGTKNSSADGGSFNVWPRATHLERLSDEEARPVRDEDKGQIKVVTVVAQKIEPRDGEIDKDIEHDDHESWSP